MMEWLDDRVAECSGVTCESIVIGQTHEGRDMKVIKVGEVKWCQGQADLSVTH